MCDQSHLHPTPRAQPAGHLPCCECGERSALVTGPDDDRVAVRTVAGASAFPVVSRYNLPLSLCMCVCVIVDNVIVFVVVAK